MIRPRALLSLTLLALLGASCIRQVTSSRPAVAYVNDILSDRNAPEMQLLKRSSKPLPEGEIVIIGPAAVSHKLAEHFAAVEQRDNVDGRKVSDYLPDFAGETFSCIADDVDYASVLQTRGEDVLREMVVRRALAALDTAAHVSPYDIEGLSHKHTAKAIILADPYLAEYGAFDVDTLFMASGCGIPVMVPLDMLLDKAFSNSPERNVSIGIVSTFMSKDAPYSRRFSRKAAEYGKPGSECVTYVNDGRDSLLHHFLDAYLNTGYSRPLDAIVVDDVDVNLESLKSELASILSIMNESSMTYGRLISRDFRIYESKDILVESCYSFLRKGNLFTHNIAMPKVESFRVAPKPQTTDGSIILINSNYVQN